MLSREVRGELRALVELGCPGASVDFLDIEASDKLVSDAGLQFGQRRADDVLSSVWVHDATELVGVVETLFGRLAGGECLVGTSKSLDAGLARLPTSCAFQLLLELVRWDGDEVIVAEPFLRWCVALDLEPSARPGQFRLEFWVDTA